MRRALADVAPDLERAVSLLREGSWDSASALLKDVIWRDPSNPVAYTALGLALIQLGQTGHALEAMERAHYLAPEDPRSLYEYGLALKAAGRPADAQQRFAAAKRMQSRHEAVSRQLAGLSTLFTSVASTGAPLGPSAALYPPAPEESQAGQAPPPRSLPDQTPRGDEETKRPGAEAAVFSPALPASSDPWRQTAPVLPEADRGAASRPAALAPALGMVGDADPDRESLPGFFGLLGATLQLWLQQPLPWLTLLALVNTAAISLALAAGKSGLAASLIWSLALAAGAAPALLIMADQWILGRSLPRLGADTRRRLLRGCSLALPYLLLMVSPLAVSAGSLGSFPLFLVIPAALVLGLPFHALVAPALVLAVTEGPGGLAALRTGLRLASRRTWLHLGVMLALTLVAGGLLAGLIWVLARTLVGVGDAVLGLWEVLGLSLGEGLWCAMMAVCGTDALAARFSQGGSPPDPVNGSLEAVSG